VREVFATMDWSIHACRQCTNAWTVPSPAQVSYDEEDWHGQFGTRSVADLPAQWRSALIKQVGLLARTVPGGSRILEIGCGHGLLLSELQRRGYQVVGIEPSHSAASIAAAEGLDVRTGYFPASAPEGPFDAVIMSHVLEHIENPHVVLDQVQALASAGFVLFAQTNWRGLLPRLERQNWYAWVPEQHFWHFTPKGLRSLLNQHGWKVVEVEYTSLEHGGNPLSRAAAVMPGQGDQFHLLARVPG
jgi:2-polyprenyl-3-methyl-5-hydroxy-6-metoxy-1,4-benzoquinol methylase